MVWSLLKVLLMTWTDRQEDNSIVEALRIQVSAPETDSKTGTLKKGTRVHMAEMRVSSYSFLRMRVL